MSFLDDNLLGRQVDDYRIDKPLGQGGMARVYRALDVRLRRYVALKIIAPTFHTDDEYARRFEREAQAVARLDHPNIVHIYRFGEVDSLYYLAMQFVDGADLHTLIADYKGHNEVMAITDVLRVIQDIGAALDYMHSKGVIHRDVKPANIMVDNHGRAILTDFGLALLSDVGTQGKIFGSASYISPEQATSSASVMPQSDIYSLGVSLFEMLTGELPFTSDEPTDLAMHHLSTPPPAPSHFNPAIPPFIDAVVLQSLAKDPFDRYQTGAELSTALQGAVAQWQTKSVVPNQEVRRPSLMILPQKVSYLKEVAPLPAIEDTLEPTVLPRANATPPSIQPAPPPPTLAAKTWLAKNRPSWLSPLLFASVLFILGLMGIIIILLATRN
jgi:eukaryotic-like serine/threonine-protein kinase